MCANTAGFMLLSKWNRELGQITPSDWQQRISDTFSSNESQEVEAQHKGRRFSFMFVPVTITDYVKIYGRDIIERKNSEENA